MAAARAREPEEIDYMSDLSLAPGWPMPPLLTVAAVECDGASRSWLPVEDRRDADDLRVIDPVGVHLGRGLMRVHTCPADPAHPQRIGFQ
ncbi:hypothetical protein ACWGN5_36925 [Streptomyces sp. NPDC055815]